MSADMPPGGFRERMRAWWRVVGVAWRASRWRALVALSLTVFEQTWAPVFAVSLGWITQGAAEGDRDLAMRGVFVIAAWCAAASISATFSFQLRLSLRERATHQVELDLVELTAGIPGLEHLERPEYADRVEALNNQRGLLAGAFDALCWNVASAVSLGSSLGVLATLDGPLSLLPVFGLPSVWFANRSGKRTEATREEVMPSLRMFRRLFDIAVSPIAGKELRVFGADRPLRELHIDASRSFERTWARTTIRNGIDGLIGHVLFTGAFVAAIALLIGRVASGQAQLGEVAAALVLAATIQDQIRQLVQMAQWARTSAEAARRYSWLVDHATLSKPLEHPPNAIAPPAKVADGIRFTAVSFRYPGTDVDALSEVELFLPAGSIVAIVGDNGAGKSTLVKLLARFYEPSTGSVSVDGIEMSRISATEWRRRISAGFQDFARFELTAGESVGLGDLPLIDDVTAQEEALDRAAGRDVVDGLPEGLATQLGKSFADGHELSGGQWQKIALARAMMRKQPLLLLLDEPTAALDADTEHRLFDRFAAAAKAARASTGAITVLVSHRFSTVRAADLIVVIEGGAVTEVGSHHELIARGGIYAELYEMQASSYR